MPETRYQDLGSPESLSEPAEQMPTRTEQGGLWFYVAVGLIAVITIFIISGALGS